MRKVLVMMVAVLALMCAPRIASAGVGVSIGIGLPFPGVVVAPPAVYAPPVYAPPPVVYGGYYGPGVVYGRPWGPRPVYWNGYPRYWRGGYYGRPYYRHW
jgi:hypothetical protein